MKEKIGKSRLGAAFSYSESMSNRSVIETDLDKARKELTALQNDLPPFHALLTDNEQDAQRLREQRASLDAQAQARGRVQVAKEMLEQHQADIQNARAEVDRLEALKQREQKLAQMAKAAAAAETHRAAMDEAFSNGTKAMHHAIELLLKEWTAEHEARREFAQVGAELVPRFNSVSDPAHAGMTNDERLRFEADRATLLDELLERDVPLDAVTDGATGRHSSLDKYPERELPRDDLSLLLWQAFLSLEGREGHEFRSFSRFVPRPQLHRWKVH